MKGSVFVDLTGRRRKIMLAAGGTLAALAVGYIVALIVGLLGGPQAPGSPFGTHGRQGKSPSPGTGQAEPGTSRSQGGGRGVAPLVPRDAPRRPGATAAPGAPGAGGPAATSTPGAPTTSSTRGPAGSSPTATPTPSPTASAGKSGG